MSMMHPRPGPHPVHTIHRISAVAIGGFLCVFGGLGLAQGPPMLTTHGAVVLGLATNGLLALISVVVGAVLIGSAAVGGNAASSISIVLGGLFILSGVANNLVIGTETNLLAFRLSNVLFSLVVGAVLLITGAWGRMTGGLPLDNPYHRDQSEVEPHAPAHPDWDPAEAGELAEAERAYALHYATKEQLARLTEVRAYRTEEDRLRAWHDSAEHVDHSSQG
jgi:hypothetical protein